MFKVYKDSIQLDLLDLLPGDKIVLEKLPFLGQVLVRTSKETVSMDVDKLPDYIYKVMFSYIRQ